MSLITCFIYFLKTSRTSEDNNIKLAMFHFSCLDTDNLLKLD